MTDNTLISYYKAQYEDTTPLKDNEIVGLLEGIKNQDEDAKNRLIGANIRLIVSIASKFSKPSDDLIHEGILGLFAAADVFDPTKDTKFSTAAYMYIQHNMVEFMSNFSNAVRIPSRKYSIMKQIDEAQNQAVEELNRALTVDELATLLEKSPKLIVSILEEMKLRQFNDLIPETITQTDMHPNDIFKTDKIARLNEALSQLSPRDEYVLRFKYGIGEDNFKPRSDEEIAAIFQISPKSVLPIEKSALKRLKDYPEIIEMLQG